MVPQEAELHDDHVQEHRGVLQHIGNYIYKHSTWPISTILHERIYLSFVMHNNR